MYRIEHFHITKLWEHRKIRLDFFEDVNILIGRNASGKTTILNLLHSILSADLDSILKVDFEEAEIELKKFEGEDDLGPITITVEHKNNRYLKIKFAGEENFSFELDDTSGRSTYTDETGRSTIGRSPRRLMYRDETDISDRRTLSRYLTRGRTGPEEFYNKFTNLVPLVWLPVSRRLTVPEYGEERSRTNSLESVDLRLYELLEDLSRYHSTLNARLSEHYREFERQVLSAILYNKDHDQPDSILESIRSLPTETEIEKEQLIEAFSAAGFLDEQMRNRINQHFDTAKEAVERISNIEDIEDADLKFKDTLVFPLISRTKDMVEYARKLEKDRGDIFAQLRLYEESANSFLHNKSIKRNKSIKIDESGKVKVKVGSSPSSDLEQHRLSSGEKQILILLTEALLKSDKPVVYIADEPELSLHVQWQEKLLESLVKLGGKIQVIVATHSPDIAGKFRDNIIDLEVDDAIDSEVENQ